MEIEALGRRVRDRRPAQLGRGRRRRQGVEVKARLKDGAGQAGLFSLCLELEVWLAV